MSLLSSLRFVLGHPLNRARKLSAFARWLRWQIGSRLQPGAVLVPFVEDLGLLIRAGMTGATGNLYCGLHEYEDMALVLHALRKDDLFVDVGANIGSYSMLGAASKAAVVAFEPIPATFAWLQKNVAVNGVADRVGVLNQGVGRGAGLLRFTAGLDTVNHVLAVDEFAEDALEVPVVTLDQALAGRSPNLIKIDVEGFETEVLAGAEQTLADPALMAVIMELNGSGARYGFDEDSIHQSMLERGFQTYRYDPEKRALLPLQGKRSDSGNTLYVRDFERLSERVRSARRYRLGTGVEV